MRRFALVLVAVLAALVLAACGSGNKKPTTTSGPSAQAQIKSAYVKVFSDRTPISERVVLLQNGSKFKPVIQAFASTPLSENVIVTVSSVTLQGANKAKVGYQVKLVEGASPPKQTGAAVRQNGTWKVGDASLCKLIALQGSTPAACKS